MNFNISLIWVAGVGWDSSPAFLFTCPAIRQASTGDFPAWIKPLIIPVIKSPVPPIGSIVSTLG
jgi:hypothetical protein